MIQIIIFPRGQLCDEDRANLCAAGVVPIEADDPSKVVQLMPGSTLINADDLLMSALAGIESSTQYSVGSKMVSVLYARLKAKEAAREQAQKEVRNG